MTALQIPETSPPLRPENKDPNETGWDATLIFIGTGFFVLLGILYALR